ncbi:MAG: ATP-grasp domain-containing protein [Chitinivibrionales bacterium]|nr:ATP-grasp domain-containing protein [Chitinivibrionales bacterium]
MSPTWTMGLEHMAQALTVTCLVDEATVPHDDSEFRTPPARAASTEYQVIGALRDLGHDVRIVAATDDVAGLVRELVDNRPDVVCNLTELFRWDRRLDANVAGLLQMLNVPFTGAGASGLMLCRNKGLSKHLLNARKIRVPSFAVLHPGRRPSVPKSLRFPLVVKPLLADGSEGISNASLVRTMDELVDRAALIHTRFNQPAIAEQFIDGREIYVGVLGERRLTVLPPRELFFGRSDEGGPVLATYKLKWDDKYRERWQVRFGPSPLEPRVAQAAARISRRAFHILQLRDYGRVDLRLTPDNRLYVLEVNPNPNLARDDELAEAAAAANIGYQQLIEQILRCALRRGA